MGVTRTDLFNEKQNRIATLAKVIGHPARVSILQFLQKSSSSICGDIVQEIGLSQPTISQHLRELKQVGLIKGNIDGTKVCYCIDRKTFNEAKALFKTLLSN